MSEGNTHFSEFIKNQDARDKVIKDLLNSGTVERFIELLLRIIKYNEPSEPFHFISSIAEIASSHPVKVLQEKPGDVLKSGPVRQLWWITEITLEKVSPIDRSNILLDLSKKPEFISLAAFGLNYCLCQHGFYDERDQIKKELRWVNDTQLEKLKNEWIDSVVKKVQQNAFFDISDTTHVLSMLRSVDSVKTEDVVEYLISKDEDLDSFAKAIGRGGQDSIKGEYSHVSEDVLNAFGGADMIRKRVKSRMESPIEDIALNAIYNSILTGKGYYLVDNTKRRNF